ncbi:MAG: ATP-dependent sacrificial sulfur transferase LarE [Planctomycetes bacterium]|nr:ATP-dependent sacrificial sulfur transferase LarE [Planctomycetota bacterium]
MTDLENKRERLLEVLRGLKRVAVAFSGGIDSTVVAQAAFLALGDAAVAVTADSPSVPRAELAEAKELAARIGIRHRTVTTTEFANPDYVKNDGTRCYHCKDELYSQIEELLPILECDVPFTPDASSTVRRGQALVICSGANLDDRGDYRPGLVAASEHRVRHPLQEAGFTKADVRALAQVWNLPTWDKPASPCLSSRLAPGVTVTTERTARIEAAEAYLKKLGHREFRVRLHEGELARIEVGPESLANLADPHTRADLVRYLKTLGFRYVTLDLEGFRSGSLNELIPLEMRVRNQELIEGEAR